MRLRAAETFDLVRCAARSPEQLRGFKQEEQQQQPLVRLLLFLSVRVCVCECVFWLSFGGSRQTGGDRRHEDCVSVCFENCGTFIDCSTSPPLLARCDRDVADSVLERQFAALPGV